MTPEMSPRPLAMHLALQTLTWLASLNGLTQLKSASGGSNPFSTLAASRGDPALAARLSAADADRLYGAVAREAERRLAEFAAGVERYRTAPRMAPEPTPTVWRDGTTRLRDYGRAGAAAVDAPPVLVVPSLINRARVLRAGTIAVKTAQGGAYATKVDWDDTLETVIRAAKGRADAMIAVLKDGQVAGQIEMSELLAALIPYSSTQDSTDNT